MPLGSSVMPMLGTEDVMWTCKFRNGTIKRFKFPIRTTAEARSNACEDLRGHDIESGLLVTEEADGIELSRYIKFFRKLCQNNSIIHSQ